MPHAQEHINHAIETLERTSDKWMSLSDKSKYRRNAINEILDITPGMMDELEDCPLGGNLDNIESWMAKYWNPYVLKDAVTKNYVKHGMKMLVLMGEAYGDYAQNDFYDLGYEVGQIGNLLIVEAGNEEIE